MTLNCCRIMPEQLPSFSIIIPTLNRPMQLENCFKAIAELDYHKKFLEIIVVKDGGEANVKNVVNLYNKVLPIKLLQQSNTTGPAAARQRGVEVARGDYLAFIDDDCLPANDWLRVMARYTIDYPDCIIGGKTVNSLKENLFSTTSQLIVDIVYNHYNHNPQEAHFFATNNMVVPAKQFQKLGGFNTSFKTSEDRELCNRWLHNGWQMIFAKEAIMYHAHSLSFSTFCKQHFNYGRGAYNYHKVRSERASGHFITELKFHFNIRNWLIFLNSQGGLGHTSLLLGTLLLWQIANAFGFFWEGIKSVASILKS